MTDKNPSPQHGTTSKETDGSSKKSMSQADGTASQDPKGETQAQPSSPDGQNPATAGRTNAPVKSQTPENREGKINPSAPTAGTEGGENKLGQQFASDGPPTMDSAGETGTQTGKGTLEVDEQNVSAAPQGKRSAGNVEREFAGKDSGREEKEEDIEGAA